MKNAREKRPFRAEIAPGEALALDPKAFGFLFEAPPARENQIRDDGTAVVVVRGPLEQHAGSYWDSYDAITMRVREALANPDVRAVVLRIDSPGGEAAGSMAAHRRIRSMRKKFDKPIYAYADEYAASAAYAIASAADEIWLPDTGSVGSIGVIATLCDRTKALAKSGLRVEYVVSGERKADWHDAREITPEIMQVAQDRVDELAAIFFGIVAEARDMKPAAVEGLQAAVFMGADAVKAGVADGVASWPKFLRLVKSAGIGSLTPSSAAKPAASSSTEKSRMSSKKKILALTQAKEAAQTALLEASTTKEKKKAMAKLDEATIALARAEAPSPAPAAKAEKTRDEEDKDDDDDGDKDDDEEEDDEEEEDGTDGGTDGGDDDDDDETTGTGEEEEEEEEEEARANQKAFLSGKLGVYTPKKMLALVRKVTGEKSIPAIFGALASTGNRLVDVKKIEKRTEKLEADVKRDRVKRMLERALTDGKITKAEASSREGSSMFAKGMQDPKFLKGFLSGLSKRYRTTASGGFEPRAGTDGSLAGGVDEVEQGIAAASMAGLSDEERAMAKATLRDIEARKKSGAGDLSGMRS